MKDSREESCPVLGGDSFVAMVQAPTWEIATIGPVQGG